MTDPCADRLLLIQAHQDDELDAASSAELMAHAAGCPGCAAMQAELGALSRGLRAEMATHAAPDALRDRLASRFRPARPAHPPAASRTRPVRIAAAFGLGALLAASVMLLLLPGPGGQADEIVAAHIRALQPGHLTDVLSTDQHTVKPWFDGRVDFAPPVRDLTQFGFPLIGGRLDFLHGRPVAALVYRRDKHLIDLFVAPGTAVAGGASERQGYNVVGWSEGGMVFQAVSDLAAADLAAFARDWRAGS